MNIPTTLPGMLKVWLYIWVLRLGASSIGAADLAALFALATHVVFYWIGIFVVARLIFPPRSP